MYNPISSRTLGLYNYYICKDAVNCTSFMTWNFFRCVAA